MTGKHRVSREVAKAAADKMIAAIQPFCDRIEICGSYRRGRTTCGDVDLLVTGKPESLKAFHNACDTIFVSGEAKVRGMKDDVQVEIRLVPEECWGAALMHTTGSAELNKIQRAHAKSMGMALNEYGLWKVNADGTKTLLTSHDEKEIYKILGLKWLEPTERDILAPEPKTTEAPKEIKVEVSSSSNPEKKFTVRYRPEKEAWDCNCPDFKYRGSVDGRDCKHIRKVKEAQVNPNA